MCREGGCAELYVPLLGFTHSTRYAPHRVELWVNLAHAYLLNGQDSEARRLYAKFKGTKLSDGKTFDDQVLEDLAEFRERCVATGAKIEEIQHIFARSAD